MSRLNETGSVVPHTRKVSDMKVVCKDLGLKISGKKNELVERIRTHREVKAGERNSRGKECAVEFDRPSHFLASGAPTGATLLQQRHLSCWATLSWAWDGCQGAFERSSIRGANWGLAERIQQPNRQLRLCAFTEETPVCS